MRCGRCGEDFFSVSVMERIDSILSKIEKISSKIFIMDYQSAA